MSNRIVLGSGNLYISEATASNGVYTIPADATIETENNRLGYIQGGATLEYTPTFYNVKDDLGVVGKRFLTEEAVTFKSGILTWNGQTLAKLCASAQVDTITESGQRIVKIGGIEHFDNKAYVLRFVHDEDSTNKIRITLVGNNTNGFELQFQANAETVVNAEFEALPGAGEKGVLVVYEEVATA